MTGRGPLKANAEFAPPSPPVPTMFGVVGCELVARLNLERIPPESSSIGDGRRISLNGKSQCPSNAACSHRSLSAATFSFCGLSCEMASNSQYVLTAIRRDLAQRSTRTLAKEVSGREMQS